MFIRPLEVDDYPAATDLLVETFRPYFEDYLRPLVGDSVFQRQHGRWQLDYHDMLPTLHASHCGRHAVVAHDGATITGLVSWRFDQKPHCGEIFLLAVSPRHRRRHVGGRLCRHAIDHLRAAGVDVVTIGTGGDPFHAPARALYEHLGFTGVPGTVYLGGT